MALDKNSIHYIIFDLDDTLLDTLGQLVHPATREACEAMIEAGLQTNLQECLRKRQELFTTSPRENLYHNLAQHFGVRPGTNAVTVEKAGVKAFYDREIHEDLQPFPDALETLKQLAEKFTLFLVTLGAPRTQKKKVELLRLSCYFKKVIYVDVAQGGEKTAAFKQLLTELKAEPQKFLSVGNRIDSDIRSAKELKMQAILMTHGEYLHLKPQHPFEEPDARIKKIGELVGLLQ